MLRSNNWKHSLHIIAFAYDFQTFTSASFSDKLSVVNFRYYELMVYRCMCFLTKTCYTHAQALIFYGRKCWRCALVNDCVLLPSLQITETIWPTVFWWKFEERTRPYEVIARSLRSLPRSVRCRPKLHTNTQQNIMHLTCTIQETALCDTHFG